MRRLRRLGALLATTAILAVGFALTTTSSCGDSKTRKPTALAQQVTNRNQLIGGPNALGEVGDFLLQNDEIRLVVQDEGYNRGSGLFGGSLIDADLVRTNAEGNLYGGNGLDTFGELFPAFFLEAINPEEVSVISDGSDGGAAVVEVAGRGGEFVTMLRYINQVMVNSYDPKNPLTLADNSPPPDSDGRPLARFSSRYILEPGARHVRIESTITNNSFRTLTFPNEQILNLLSGVLGLDLGNFTVPTGHVLGFGAVNSIFVPGIGYDLRWGLEEAYRRDVSLPAFPGHLTQFVATSNPSGISYGFFSAPSKSSNFAYQKDQDGNYYGGEAEPDDLLMLFYASGFGGVFSNELPGELAPAYCDKNRTAQAVCDDILGECGDDLTCRDHKLSCKRGYQKCLDEKKTGKPSSYTFTNYFVVGDGDVSSITDEMYAVKGIETTKVRGRVFDELSGEPVGENMNVLWYRPREGMNSEQGCTVEGEGADKETPIIFNQSFTNSDGYFGLKLPPGHYCYRTRKGNRPISDYHHVEVGQQQVFLRTTARSRARVEARITDSSGIPVPAKMTVVGTHEYRGDTPKRHYLYNLDAGEHWQTSDLRPDKKNDPSTRRYIEAVAYSAADGRAEQMLQPGDYQVFFSRGPEYNLVQREISVKAGQTARMNVQLKKVVDTDGYLSGDFHMHAAGSIDSGLDYDKRVISIAAEDVEVVASSDHNYVSDYLPYIRRNELQPWLRSIVGVELTTFEFGHFNAFPIDYKVGSINRGSIRWQNIPPQRIFDELRSRGTLGEDKTIIQVNHPRDSILGYFSQYGVDPFDMSVSLPFKGPNVGGQEKVIAKVSSPNGPSYYRDCRPESISCVGPDGGREPKVETSFSWDFDALEIFNGKRMELLRHYRIPYAEGEWPEQTARTLLENICANEDSCEAPMQVVGARCCPMGETKVEDDTVVCKDDTALEEACQNKKGHGVDAEIQTLLAERYPKDAILCEDGEIAYPGGLDDWYSMLNHSRPFIENTPGAPQQDKEIYQKVTATGNSDSHHAGKPELIPPGHPRNYVRVGHDDPQSMKVRDFITALQNNRNIVTNGPFAVLEVEAGGKRGRVGDEISTDAKEVQLKVSVEAADWVGADRFRIIANGEPVEFAESDDNGWVEFDLDEEGTYGTSLPYRLEEDTWFVLEVRGDNNLFPVYAPTEIPRIPFDDIIGQIAGSFGFGGDVEGLAPSEVFPLRPFAFTNPIWVVGDGDGQFTPPNPSKGQCENGVFEPKGLVNSDTVDNAMKIDARMRGVDVPLNRPDPDEAPLRRPKSEYRDVRTLFRAFGHSH